VKSAGRKSIIFRLTLLFASASTAVLLVLGLLIGNSVEHHFEVQDMEVLTGKLELTRHALEKVHSQSDLDALPQQLDDSLVGHHGLAVIVVAPSGQTLFVTSGAEFPQVLLARSPDMTNSGPIIWKSTDHIPLRGISAMVKTGIEGAKPAVVAVATDISKHEHFMSSFRFTLWSVVDSGCAHDRISRLGGCQTRVGAIARDQAGGGGHYSGSPALQVSYRIDPGRTGGSCRDPEPDASPSGGFFPALVGLLLGHRPRTANAGQQSADADPGHALRVSGRLTNIRMYLRPTRRNWSAWRK
jgi:hypothetical protein